MAQSGTALGVRQEMPAFELPDEEGRPFSSAKQLEEDPLVLIFYRGD